MRKKRNIIIALLLLTLALSARAQVFIMEEDEGPDRNVLGVNGTFNNVIVHGSTDDGLNYDPIGDGIMLLAALGGAYLLRKKSRK